MRRYLLVGCIVSVLALCLSSAEAAPAAKKGAKPAANKAEKKTLVVAMTLEGEYSEGPTAPGVFGDVMLSADVFGGGALVGTALTPEVPTAIAAQIDSTASEALWYSIGSLFCCDPSWAPWEYPMATRSSGSLRRIRPMKDVHRHAEKRAPVKSSGGSQSLYL